MGSNSVLRRWLDILGEFDFTLVHHLGCNLIPADRQSRLIFVRDADNEGDANNDAGSGHMQKISTPWNEDVAKE